MGAIFRKLLGPIIRHGLTGLGGFLISHGIIDNMEVIEQLINPTTEIGTGLAIFAVGVLASVFKVELGTAISKIWGGGKEKE